MQLLLIRHARNDWVGDRLAGWTPGVHLNDAGRAEALALAARLASYPLDAVYASSSRARPGDGGHRRRATRPLGRDIGRRR